MLGSNCLNSISQIHGTSEELLWGQWPSLKKLRTNFLYKLWMKKSRERQGKKLCSAASLTTQAVSKWEPVILHVLLREGTQRTLEKAKIQGVSLQGATFPATKPRSLNPTENTADSTCYSQIIRKSVLSWGTQLQPELGLSENVQSWDMPSLLNLTGNLENQARWLVVVIQLLGAKSLGAMRHQGWQTAGSRLQATEFGWAPSLVGVLTTLRQPYPCRLWFLLRVLALSVLK